MDQQRLRDWSDRNLVRVREVVFNDLPEVYQRKITDWLWDFWGGDMPWTQGDHGVVLGMMRAHPQYPDLCQKFNEKYGVEFDPGDIPEDTPPESPTQEGTPYPVPGVVVLSGWDYSRGKAVVYPTCRNRDGSVRVWLTLDDIAQEIALIVGTMRVHRQIDVVPPEKVGEFIQEKIDTLTEANRVGVARLRL